jgi:hypothetical protein
MPTEEPSRAGLTKTGYPNGFETSSRSRIVWCCATGTPLSRNTFLNRSLSMQSADAATPAPTYGTPASSSRP